MNGIHDIPKPKGSTSNRKRVGRGPGSGTGKTSGYGHKGAKARTGSHGPGAGKPGYEGGQMPLHRRLPKRGFTNPNRVEYQLVNLFQLEAMEENDITLEVLTARGAVSQANRPVKVLGTGELTRSIKVSAHKFSKSAREKIEGAGGSIQELG